MPITPDPTAGSGSPNGTELLAFMRPPSTAAAGDDAPRRPRKVVLFPAPTELRCRQMAVEATIAGRRLAADPGLVLSIAAELLALDDDAFATRMMRLCGDDLGTALLAETIEAIDGTMGDLARANAALLTLRLRLSAGAGEGGRDVR